MTPSNGDAPTRVSHVCSLEVEECLDSTVVRLCGEFDLASEERFDQEIKQLMDRQGAGLVLDLRRLTFIDSTGLRMLISLTAASDSNGFDLTILCDEEGSISRVLRETGVDGILPLVDPVSPMPANGGSSVRSLSQ